MTGSVSQNRETSASADEKTAGSGSASMFRPGRFGGRWVMALVAWTLFVWGGRLRNLFIDDGGFAEAGPWSLWGSVAFVALSLGVVGTSYFGPGRVASALLGALCVLTVGVWLVRGVDIAIGDHSAGFITVHIVLAAVSIGLAVLAARAELFRPAHGAGA